MKFLSLYSFTLFLGILFFSSASAQTVYEPQREWQYNVSRGADGTFSYCSTDNRYSDRYLLIFSRKETGETAIVFYSKDAQFTAGQSISITLRIDRAVTKEFSAIPTSPETLTITLGLDEGLYRNFMSGSVLSLQLPTETLRFRLMNTRIALTQLKQCSENKGVGFPQRPDSSEQNAQQILSLLLSSFEPVIRSLGMYNVPFIKEDRLLGWVFGPLTPVGFIKLVQNPENVSLSVLVKSVIEEAQSRCKGASTVDVKAVQQLSNTSIQIQFANIICTTTDRSNYTGFLLHKIPEVVLIYTVEGSIAQRGWADDVLNKLAERIKELNTQTPPAPQTQTQE